MLRRRTIAMTAVAVSAVLLLGQPLPTQAVAGVWQSQPVQQRTVLNGELDDLACPATGECTSVGVATIPTGERRLITETLHAGSWTAEILPRTVVPGMVDVVSTRLACETTSTCVIAGNETPGHQASLAFAAILNNGSWRGVTPPVPDGVTQLQLDDVSCWASGCVVVGSAVDATNHKVPITETLDGTTWSIIPMPIPAGATDAELHGLSCTGKSSCVAAGSATVGGKAEPLVSRLNAAGWHPRTLPAPPGTDSASLQPIDCTDTTDCVAVGQGQAGTFTRFVTETLSGTTWTAGFITGTLAPQGVNDVSCPAVATCVLTGEAGNAALLGSLVNGTFTAHTFSLPGSAAVNQFPWLSAVACPAPGACVAAGVYDAKGVTTPLLVSEADPQWLFAPQVTGVNGPNGPALYLVSCADDSHCVAIGSLGTSPVDPIAETWSGTTWRISTIPATSGFDGVQTNALSCGGPSACVAVGSDVYKHAAQPQWSARVFDGTSWIRNSPPLPAGSVNSVLLGVSCASASSCTATGEWESAGYAVTPVVLHWNGSSWTTLPAPPSGMALGPISCRDTTCTGIAGVAEQTAFATWNGSTWSVVPAAQPAGVQLSLNALACPTTTTCFASGSESQAGAAPQAVFEVLQGSAVSLSAASDPDFAFNPAQISCTDATTCVAIGSTVGSNGVVAAAQVGVASWSAMQAPVVPPYSRMASMDGISCSSAGCVAVGSSLTSNLMGIGFAEHVAP